MTRPASGPGPEEEAVSLATVAREWGRIGMIGFGGTPAHIALLRRLCVGGRGWLPAGEFEDGIAWRLRGRLGAAVGGLCFIAPGLVVILALSAVYLARHSWGRGWRW